MNMVRIPSGPSSLLAQMVLDKFQKLFDCKTSILNYASEGPHFDWVMTWHNGPSAVQMFKNQMAARLSLDDESYLA